MIDAQMSHLGVVLDRLPRPVTPILGDRPAAEEYPRALIDRRLDRPAFPGEEAQPARERAGGRLTDCRRGLRRADRSR
jgi:hypothetical protein